MNEFYITIFGMINLYRYIFGAANLSTRGKRLIPSSEMLQARSMNQLCIMMTGLKN